jgi:putative membrane protein
MKMMVDGHQDVIDQFEKASKDVTDPEIKNFATTKLPTLKAHLDSAKAIQKALK